MPLQIFTAIVGFSLDSCLGMGPLVGRFPLILFLFALCALFPIII